MVWEYLERGLAAGAWLDGLVISLGGFMALLYFMIRLAVYAAGGGQKEDDL